MMAQTLLLMRRRSLTKEQSTWMRLMRRHSLTKEQSKWMRLRVLRLRVERDRRRHWNLTESKRQPGSLILPRPTVILYIWLMVSMCELFCTDSFFGVQAKWVIVTCVSVRWPDFLG
eukprot:Gregarina_sp_Pseudo_9__1279@NODE_1850_length_1294_cov_662_140239_g1716_i0_p2_GENE_NODE_1850_length_1294_cov_662_140239_g1716_i0NODE_1850_length_1294_cov_662_140239_g1716_i0_p2_ORF_typecomplete_len116_score4_58TMEM239/PF15841_5/0_017_NODE_1850_length_1294_cov_662_140239_g1716_i0250597